MPRFTRKITAKKYHTSKLLFLACALLSIFSALCHAEKTTFTLPGITEPVMATHNTSPPSINNNSFTLTAIKGTDLYTTSSGEKKADNVPRLLFEAKSDFILSAKVTSQFGADYDGGGLLVYAGENQWAKLLIEQVPNKTLLVSSSVTNTKGDGAYHAVINQPYIYLKIVRLTNRYFFYSSLNGKDWQILRDFALGENESTKVGFYNQTPIGEKIETLFSEISFRETTIKNYWQGE